ncbi:MAG TPA: sulfite exporter TauE/SafE family protein [Candidatus Limnocylindrales bacterium]
MLPLEALALLAAVGAGAFGALVGVGGGVILVPLLTVFLGVPVTNAVAVSLLGVIAVSTTASASYLSGGLVDRRVGLTLLVATALGGVAGGYIAGYLDVRVISGLFGVVLVAVAIQMLRSHGRPVVVPSGDPLRFEFDASYVEPTSGATIAYRARHLWPATFVSLFAGALSGLLGIGGGVVNVPTMNVLMGLPIRVSTTTSTYMLGATAAASAVLYASRGEVDLALAAPVVVGVFIGGRAGAIFQRRVPQHALALSFAVIAAFFAVQMLLRTVNG